MAGANFKNSHNRVLSIFKKTLVIMGHYDFIHLSFIQKICYLQIFFPQLPPRNYLYWVWYMMSLLSRIHFNIMKLFSLSFDVNRMKNTFFISKIVLSSWEVGIQIKPFNPFVPNAPFLYPLNHQKTLRFSDVFRR